MKQTTWRKHHKWFGLLFCFFMLMFCVSGIILNHRPSIADVNVGRKWLPSSYRFTDWNGGLLRGSLRYTGKDSVTRVLLYGNSGIWLTDTAATSFTDFNKGFPKGADYRNIRGVVRMPGGTLLAAGLLGLYRHDGERWTEVSLPADGEERLSDIIAWKDTVIVTGRSFLYLSVSPYREFRQIAVRTPEDYDGKASLFRTVWLLHSGELFGMAGKLLMDGVAIILILLCLTGVLYWFLPKYIRKARHAGKEVTGSTRLLRGSLNWHDKLGRWTFCVLLFVAFTGWCLRPPVLIALVYGKVPPIPGSKLDSPNAWHDKLRMLRYDETCGDWLLSTSEGFYSLASPYALPVRMERTPPVSVMGLNVWWKDAGGHWLTGSFSGMYVWDRRADRITDYFTGEECREAGGSPFGKRAVSGFMADCHGKGYVVEYGDGSDFAPMPEQFASLPMSLWNLSLEVHTGRIYTFLGGGTLIYIFFAGLVAVWCLWTGYAVRRRKTFSKGGTTG